MTRVSYQDHHHDNYAPISRRVIVRKKILRPRQRHRTVDVVHHVDRPLATVPVDTLHPVAGYEVKIFYVDVLSWKITFHKLVVYCHIDKQLSHSFRLVI